MIFIEVFTHHWKCQLAKKKELLIPPIWGCCGLTGNSYFTHEQIKYPTFSDIAAKTHMTQSIRPTFGRPIFWYTPALKKAGCLICPTVKNEPQVGPQQPQIGGIITSFFGQLALPMICGVKVGTQINCTPKTIFSAFSVVHY